MRGPTLPFALTKIDGSISINLIEKRKTLFPFLSLSLSLSLSSRSLSLPPLPVCAKKWPFPSFCLTLLISFSFFFSFFFSYFLVLSFPLFPPLDTWFNVSYSHKCTTCHAMCHPTFDASNNVKFRLSRNSTKFDGVTRFCERNLTVKSVLSYKI